jgi:hypothetical protein
MSLTAYKRNEMEGFDVPFSHATTAAKTDSTSDSFIRRFQHPQGSSLNCV